jgi:hypothetical protein
MLSQKVRRQIDRRGKKPTSSGIVGSKKQMKHPRRNEPAVAWSSEIASGRRKICTPGYFYDEFNPNQEEAFGKILWLGQKP